MRSSIYRTTLGKVTKLDKLFSQHLISSLLSLVNRAKTEKVTIADYLFSEKYIFVI